MNTLFKILLVLFSLSVTVQAQIQQKILWTPPSMSAGPVYSPDGKMFVTFSQQSRDVSVWDAEYGILIRNVTSNTYPYSVQFINKKNQLAVCSTSGVVEIWDVNTGEPVKGLQMNSRIGYTSFSSDGTLASYSFGDGEIWDIENKRLIRSLKGFYIQDAYFNAKGDKVVTSGYQGTKVWDIKTGALDASYNAQTGFSNSSKRFISFENGVPTLRNTETLEPISVLPLPQGGSLYGYPSTIQFDNTRNYILGKLNVNQGLYRFVVWEASTGTILQTFEGHEHDIQTISVSPDGKKVVTTGKQESEAKVWDMKTGKLLFTVAGHPIFTTSAIFTPKGDKILTVVYYQYSLYHESVVKAWDADNGNLLSDMLAMKDYQTTVLFNPINDQILLSSKGRLQSDKMVIDVFDNQKPQKTYQIIANGAGLLHTALEPENKTMAAAFSDSTVKVLQTTTGEVLKTLKVEKDKFINVSFSQSGNYILTLSENKNARVWNAKTGELIFTVKGPIPDVRYAEFGVNDSTIITAHDDLRARVYNFINKDIMRSISGYHTAYISSASFNKQGKYILTAGSEEANIWNGETAEYIRTLSPNTYTRKAFFSPKGNSFATFSTDQWDEKTVVSTWDVETGNLIGEKRFRQLLPVALYSHSGDYLFAAHNYDEGFIVKAPELNTIAEIGNGGSRFSAAAFNHNDSLLATGNYNGSISVWNVKNGELLYGIKAHEYGISTLQFGCCNNTLYSSDGNGYIKKWVFDTTDIVGGLSIGGAETNMYNIITIQNPVGYELTMHLQWGNGGDKKYTVYNYLGDKVLSGTITGNVQSHTIAVGMLSQGIYFFALDDGKTSKLEKFTVIR